jgi:hypothetical protein
MLHSRSVNPAAKSPAMRTPYGVGLRVPTIASDRSDKDEISPLTTKPIGIACKSFNAAGHSGDSGVKNLEPVFSRESINWLTLVAWRLVISFSNLI